MSSGVATCIWISIAGKYDTYTIDLSLYAGESCYCEVFSEVLDEGKILGYSSEPFTVGTDLKAYRFEWTNNDNGFMMDYSAGLTHVMQLTGRGKRLNFAGDSSIYSNQGEDVKLKETVSRVFEIELHVPDYIAELFILATAHDHFYINEIEFVTTKKPTVTQSGNSNMYVLSGEFKQRTVIGLNTHDVG